MSENVKKVPTNENTIEFVNDLPEDPNWLGSPFQGELNAAISAGADFFISSKKIIYEIVSASMVKNVETEETISRELKIKVDNKRSLLGLEVLKINKEVDANNVAKEYEKISNTEFVVLDDLSCQYVLKFNWAETDAIKALDPDFLPEADAYEISESIQDFLIEKGFPIFKHKFPEKNRNPKETEVLVSKKLKEPKDQDND